MVFTYTVRFGAACTYDGEATICLTNTSHLTTGATKPNQNMLNLVHGKTISSASSASSPRCPVIRKNSPKNFNVLQIRHAERARTYKVSYFIVSPQQINWLDSKHDSMLHWVFAGNARQCQDFHAVQQLGILLHIKKEFTSVELYLLKFLIKFFYELSNTIHFPILKYFQSHYVYFICKWKIKGRGKKVNHKLFAIIIIDQANHRRYGEEN